MRLATYAIDGAARREAAGRELADPAGADQQHAPAREVAEDLLRERGGRGRDRRGALADRRLRADALAELERLAEDPIEQRARRVAPSYAALTWPRISLSPGTSESSPAETRKRCTAAASSCMR